MIPAMTAAGVVGLGVSEAIKSLTKKNDLRQNVSAVSGNKRETFKIRVESPEVLILKIQRSGEVTVSLQRSGAFTAHIEGTVSHITSSESVAYQRSYRSDKGGYQHTLHVSNGDVISIGMEAHHFCSALVGQGSSEMDVSITY